MKSATVSRILLTTLLIGVLMMADTPTTLLSRYIDNTKQQGRKYIQPTVLSSTTPQVEWNVTYGGTNSDQCYSVIQTNDGGYALAGRSASFGTGGGDFWLVKTDPHGDMQWNKTYGGTADDEARSAVQTSDGGYAVAGSTKSFGVGDYDFWLVKTDANGNMQWNKTYGGAGTDKAFSVIQTGDDGYAMAGYTSFPAAGLVDFWLVRTAANGTMLWNKTYGGTGQDWAYSVVETNDGSYAIGGETSSYGAGNFDFWLVKADANGDAIWNKTYGGISADRGYSMVQTSDGGYALAGYTYSFGAIGADFWLVKTDTNGNAQWNKTYGGSSNEVANCVVQTIDRGYALAGGTPSFGAGGYDFWLVKTDVDGNMKWNKTCGGTSDDTASSVVQTSDGGYALVGFTQSFGHGNNDFWIIKLARPSSAYVLEVTGFEPWYYYVMGLINSATGNLFFSTSDILVKARGFNIEVVRSYNSYYNGTDGPFGLGWTHNYNIYLVRDENGSVTKFDGDGSVHTFEPAGGNEFSSPPGVHARLTNATGVFVLRFTDGRRYEFDASDKLARITDKNGNRLTMSYVSGQLRNVSDDSGLQITFTYDGGRVSSVIDPLGRRIEYDYESGKLVNVTDATGNSTLYVYCGDSKLRSVVDRAGKALTFSYYPDGKVEEIWRSLYQHQGKSYLNPFRACHVEYGDEVAYATDTMGFTTEIRMNDFGNPTRIIDPTGNFSLAGWDFDMNMVNFTDANNHTYRYVYDSSGNLIWQMDSTGNSSFHWWQNIDNDTKCISLHRSFTSASECVTLYDYDSNGNLLKTTDPTGNSSRSIYSTYGLLLWSIDSMGNATNYGYDTHGFMTNCTDPTGNVTRYAHDQAGRLTSVTDARGNTTTYVYDYNDRCSRVIDASGNMTAYSYNAEGELVSTTDANNHVTTGETNILGEVDTETDALGNSTFYRCDREGNLVKVVDARGYKTVYFYDALGRLVLVTDALGGNESYTYDAVGNRLTLKNKNGNVTQYQYDALNRLIRETDPLGNNVTYGYDTVGNLISVTDKNNHAISYQYDALDRLIRTTDASGNFTSYTYDANGNLVSETNAKSCTTFYQYDALNRLIRVVDATGNSTKYGYDAAGNLINITNRNGNSTLYAFDALGRVTCKTDATGNETSYGYDPVGNLVYMTNARGFFTLYEYDELDRLAKLTDASGNITRYAYDANGNLASETDPMNSTTSYQYDGLGRLIATIDASGNATRYGYDAAGNCVTITDANNLTTVHQYDTLNQLIRRRDPIGDFSVFGYDPVGNLVGVLDKNNHLTTYAYDTVNRRTMTMDASGNATQYVYDALGNLVNVTDASGHSTVYHYDALNRLIKEVDATGNVTEYAYDPEGNLVRGKDKNGYVTTDVFDALGRVTKRIDATGNVTEYSYDAVGNLVALRDARGNIIKYEFDQLDRRTRVIDAYGNSTGYSYDAAGNLISETDPNGHTVTYGRNSVKKIVTETDALGNKTAYGYDAVGNRVSVRDANNHTTIYQYDALNRLKKIVDASGNETVYEYDLAWNMVGVVDANGNRTRYEYDALDRLVRATSPLGCVTSYSYDGVGNLIRQTDANGNVTQYQYDNLDRLTLISYADGSNVTYTYDVQGNLIKSVDTGGLGDIENYAYDKLYRLTSLTVFYGLFSQTIRYAYDNVSNLIIMEDPYNTTTYEYDAVDRLTKISSSVGVTTYRYDAAGDKILTCYPNGVNTSCQYDDANKLIGLVTRNSTGGIIESFVYTYDNVGNKVLEARGGGSNVTYEYDSVNRLTNVTYYPSKDNIRYTYDRAGNTLTKVVNLGNGTTYTSAYTYDKDNRLTQENSSLTGLRFFGYDKNSNLINTTDSSSTTICRYDCANRLVNVTFKVTSPIPNTWSYAYAYSPAGWNLRMQKSTGDRFYYLYTVYLVPGESVLTAYKKTIAERDDLNFYYYFVPDVGMLDCYSGNSFYLSENGFGSSTSWTDETQHLSSTVDFDPCGNIKNTTGWVWYYSTSWRHMPYWSEIGWYHYEVEHYFGFYVPSMSVFIFETVKKIIDGQRAQAKLDFAELVKNKKWKEAYQLAERIYNIDDSEAEGGVHYDPDLSTPKADGTVTLGVTKIAVRKRADGTKEKVWPPTPQIDLGKAAFRSLQMLASVKQHELVHCSQAFQCRWYFDEEGDALNEVEACDKQLKDAWWKCLSREDVESIKRYRENNYRKLHALKDVADEARVSCVGYRKPFPPAPAGPYPFRTEPVDPAPKDPKPPKPLPTGPVQPQQPTQPIQPPPPQVMPWHIVICTCTVEIEVAKGALLEGSMFGFDGLRGERGVLVKPGEVVSFQAVVRLSCNTLGPVKITWSFDVPPGATGYGYCWSNKNRAGFCSQRSGTFTATVTCTSPTGLRCTDTIKIVVGR